MPPDEFDQASELEQRQRDLAIIAATLDTKIPEGDGFCMECGAEVEGKARFCDGYCRDSWDHRRQRMKAQGRA